jgi:enoyl-CoA hydratase/carnithine racemase
MDMLKTLEVAYGPGTAVVWLNRADKQNAIDELMARELIEVFDEAALQITRTRCLHCSVY